MAHWQKVALWNMPDNAVSIGKDVDGDEIFVARAYIDRELAPGKAIPKKNVCYIPYQGRELRMTDFEVLVATIGHAAGSVMWVPESKGKIPKRAIEAGYNADGVKFYVGRTFYEGGMACGKIHPKYGVLYFPFNGEEVTSKVYEVLVAV